jgi:hypothetical protein
MQSYIYPAIAAHMDLCLVCELHFDAAFFSQADLQKMHDELSGFPSLPVEAPLTPIGGDPLIVLEHENDSATSWREMGQLVKGHALLNVLITYHRAMVSQQLDWANRTFSGILGGVTGSSRKFLLVLPGKAPGDDPQVNDSSSRKTKHADWWNFLERGGADFRRLGAAEAEPFA